MVKGIGIIRRLTLQLGLRAAGKRTDTATVGPIPPPFPRADVYCSFSARVLSILVLATSLPLAAQTASVAGMVRDGHGNPVASVEVSVEGTRLVVRSDSTGRFALSRVPIGRARLLARRLGYTPEVVELTLGDTGTVSAIIRLDILAQPVQTLTITARQSPSEHRLEGFYARSRSHNGGHFLTRDQIEQSNATSALQLLATVPGLRVTANSRLGRGVVFRSYRCQPLVFIDGFPASAGQFDLESVDPASVEGIEAYAGLGTMPPEFLGPRGLDQCGVIAIWGRQPGEGREFRLPHKLTDSDRAAAHVKAMVVAALAYLPTQVDTAAMLEPASFVPIYPVSLAQTGITARVQVEFVVDTAGSIAWETYSVMSTSDRRFNTSVREALQGAQFSAGVRAGRKVAQVVQFAAVISPP
jgi:TonB family protein